MTDLLELKLAVGKEEQSAAIINRVSNLLDLGYIYYNAQIYNDSEPIPAQYSETRTVPIVSKASDFELALARWSIPVDYVPIFDFFDQTYTVSLVYNNVAYSTTLTFFPAVSNSSTLTNSLNGAIYYVAQMVESFNAAIATSMSSLTTANMTLSTTTVAPFMYYTPTNGFFTLQCQENLFLIFNPLKSSCYI